MISTLSAGAIGVNVTDLAHGIETAAAAEFEGLEFNATWLADSVDTIRAAGVMANFRSAMLVPAVFGLPVDFRNSAEAWQEGLTKLPRLAAAAASVRCRRTATWIMPCSNDRHFDDNLAFHVERLTPIAAILGDHGISFGLEFVGPKTLRDSQTYPFVHTIDGMMEMARAIGPNVGLLLDSFHWYTSHGTVADILKLKASDVVYVHLNDGYAGRGPDEQIDGERELPLATGVIDLAGFIGALKQIGFDGPAAVEPFKASLKDLPSDAARLKVVRKSLDATLNL